ncbi:Gfo/Idh/MocA family oxidoreductase [Agromyces flavus]|uniref:Gfo/Idh/MocA family protein n=1 Tax=Agromyces flavus TaxID=589382 RepID=UPI003614199D
MLSVNQNMRFDQSIRVLKQILDGGELGEVVFASITMHAIPHWQGFLEEYDRLTLANMSVHHLDVLRFLFGDRRRSSRQRERIRRTQFEHEDGIVVSTLRFPRECSPCRSRTCGRVPRGGYDSDASITWRVEGTKGVAKGTIGWPTGEPSTLTYSSTLTTGGRWVSRNGTRTGSPTPSSA